MVFKLVRIDAQDAYKIELTNGKHVIGRGKFLHNEDFNTDKRLSRNHAELEVTCDSVTLTALHQNPCFYRRKNSEDLQLLQKNSSISLCSGDRFGLVPDVFWYELIIFSNQFTAEGNTDTKETVKNRAADNEENRVENSVEVRDNNDNGDTEVADENDVQGDSTRSISPPLLPSQELTQEYVVELPVKRSHDSEGPSEVDAKKLKTDSNSAEEKVETDGVEDNVENGPNITENTVENGTNIAENTEESGLNVAENTVESGPNIAENTVESEPNIAENTVESESNIAEKSVETQSNEVQIKVKAESDVALDAEAGPSNGQPASPDTDNKEDSKDAALTSSTQPNLPLRERCIYGANCYRRNPQHKAQFSHPTDPDWGPGERGSCPYGRACRRADPRHWTQHDHPPGVQPPYVHPPRQPGKKTKRRRRNDSVSDEDEDSPVEGLVVTGKRARKPLDKQVWGDSQSASDEDPYNTDETDEWQPPSDTTNSQDFSQDF